MTSTNLTYLEFGVTKKQAHNAVVDVCIDDDPIFQIVLSREPDGSLALCVWECANQDNGECIANTYPEYFDETV